MTQQNSDRLQLRHHNTISRANFLGFSKADLIDTNHTVAVQFAKLFAQACVKSEQEATAHFSRQILPLLLYTGSNVTEELEDAIIAVADLPGHVETDDIKTVIKLINLHADFTCSVPEGYTAASWADTLHDICINMDKGVDLIVSGKKMEGDDLLRDACIRLSRIFKDLWS